MPVMGSEYLARNAGYGVWISCKKCRLWSPNILQEMPVMESEYPARNAGYGVRISCKKCPDYGILNLDIEAWVSKSKSHPSYSKDRLSSFHDDNGGSKDKGGESANDDGNGGDGDCGGTNGFSLVCSSKYEQQLRGWFRVSAAVLRGCFRDSESLQQWWYRTIRNIRGTTTQS